jgi:hypothetical protein
MQRLCSPQCVLSLAVPLFLVVTGCSKAALPPTEPKKPNTAAVPSAEPNSFEQVTSQLDPGGNVYVYLSTEQWLAGVSSNVAAWKGLFGALPDLKPEDRENLDKTLSIAANLIQKSGIEEVSGFGMSSIARETNFYHSKLVLHHHPGKAAGFLWRMFGQKAHPLDGLNLLPATTAMTAFTDLDAPLLWSVIQKQVAQSGYLQAEELLKKLPDGFEQATGLAWDRVLASLGGEFGFALTLDDTRTVSIPVSQAGEPLEIADPALLLVAKVKDETFFQRIDQALARNVGQQVLKTDKPGLKMRTWPVPLALPIQLRPTVALVDGYLLISTTDTIMQEALAVKAGQRPGLKSTAEFQRLAKEVPTEGNGFIFTSQRFGQTMNRIRQQVLQTSGNARGPQIALLQAFLGSGQPTVWYGVVANTDEGWLAVANGNRHPVKWLALSAAIPVGIASAIAITNFVKGRNTSQQNVCINNLRQIYGAKQRWALDYKKAETDTPTREDLTPLLPKKQFPTCPAGGTYTINRVSAPPECSHAGHKLAD